MYTHNHLLHYQASRAHASKQHGLTMIELLVTISILAIMLAIGVPSFTRFIADWRLSNAVNAFSGGLRVARAEAIAQRKIVSICPTNNTAGCVANADYSGGWMVYTGTAANPTTLVRQESLTGLNTINSAGGNAVIEFLPTGIMRNSPEANFTFQANNYVDDATTGWAKKQITVGRTGRVKKS